MASLEDLQAGLVKADAAGNSADAKAFADEIRRMRNAESPLSSAGAVASGVNRFVTTQLPGMIGDTLANVGDLGIAAYGTAKRAIGGPGTEMPNTLNRASLPGTSDWFAKQMERTQTGSDIINAGAADHPTLSAVGQGIGAGMMGKSPTSMAMGGLSSGAGQLAAEKTGSQEAGILASLAPQAIPAAAGGAARAALKPSKEMQPILQDAQARGIPITPEDMTQSRFIKTVSSVLNDLPGLSVINRNQKSAQDEAFAKAVSATIMDTPTAKIDKSTFVQAKKDVGAKFDSAYNNNDLTLSGPLISKIIAIQKTAASELAPHEARAVDNWVQQLLQKEQSGIVAGPAVNNWQSTLGGQLTKPSGRLDNLLGQLRGSVIREFNDNISPADKALLDKAKSQYTALKVLEPLINAAEVGKGGRLPGDIAAGALPSAVATAMGQNRNVPELSKLSQIASQLMVDRVVRTGGGARALLQNAGVQGTLGAGSAYGLVTHPMVGIPVAAGLLGTQAALNSPRVAGWAMRQAGPAQVPLGLYPGLLGGFQGQ